MDPLAFAILLISPQARASWPSYLVFALLAIGLVAVVWQNQRARRRARPHGDQDHGQSDEMS
jgi:hypothetical protein